MHDESGKLESATGPPFRAPPSKARFLAAARRSYHAVLRKKVLGLEWGVLSNADNNNEASKAIALAIARRIGLDTPAAELGGLAARREFEIATASFVRGALMKAARLRSGDWIVQRIAEESTDDKEGPAEVAFSAQTRRLVAVAKAASENQELAAALGSDYIIKPDIAIFRRPVKGAEINRDMTPGGRSEALQSSHRNTSLAPPLLHAGISCKLTIRSGRSLDSRSEPLSLMRGPGGRLPHAVVVTAEPLPSRLASIALSTGDIDCVYHFALRELLETVRELKLSDSEEALKIMVNVNRLKDISDLPLDLAV
jgi:hypothetical protein